MTENEELALEVEELNTALGLALRQRDELQAERDEDARVVAAVVRSRWARNIVLRAPAGNEQSRVLNNLSARFADRIADLELRAAARAANTAGD